jgi:hypothetical protein
LKQGVKSHGEPSRPAVRRRKAGVFALWQPRYAVHGIATFPVVDKRPAVRGYLNIGLSGSRELLFKYPDASALGFALGKASRITVLDCDSPDERILADALAEHGKTPVIVRSGSGNYQAWYKHNNEGRQIRPFLGKPIDILGGGFVVAPPSLGQLHPYEFVQGGLDDLGQLPTLRGLQLTRPGVVPQGQRNDQLWRHCMEQARPCDDFNQLLDRAQTFNADCFPPLGEAEVIKTAESAWKYTAEGRNWFGSRGMVAVPGNVVMDLQADELYLLMRLSRAHAGLRETFAIGLKGMSEVLGWTVRRLTRARDGLLDKGYLDRIRQGGKRAKNTALYRFSDVLVPS